MYILGKKLNSNFIDRQKEQILDWLSPHEFQLKRRSLIEHRVEDTGGWLLEHPTFVLWEEGKSSKVLWCKGKRIKLLFFITNGTSGFG